MINSLRLEDDIIKNNELEGAFVSTKFLSGVENYSPEEADHLVKLLIKSS
jgi:hypothetical protein